MRRTKKDSVTSSRDESTDSGHYTAVLVFITEVGRNDVENDGAGVWWHLVTLCEIDATLVGCAFSNCV